MSVHFCIVSCSFATFSRVWPSHESELTAPAIRTDNQVTEEYPSVSQAKLSFINDLYFTCASDSLIGSSAIDASTACDVS